MQQQQTNHYSSEHIRQQKRASASDYLYQRRTPAATKQPLQYGQKAPPKQMS